MLCVYDFYSEWVIYVLFYEFVFVINFLNFEVCNGIIVIRDFFRNDVEMMKVQFCGYILLCGFCEDLFLQFSFLG